MLEHALACFERQVQAIEAQVAFFEFVHYTQRLQVVLEPAVVFHALIEHILARMSKWGVTQIMRQCNGFDQVLVQTQRPRN